MTPAPQAAPASRRSGFTLVELLVVILILAILIALLVPAIAGAVRSANVSRVAAEINNMATALADFKSKYGEFPPSRITLFNSCFYPPSDPTTRQTPTGDVSLGDINARTVRAMRKYFPRAGAYFSTSGPITPAPVDWNGPEFSATGVLLQGHECLVFFLGGMPEVVTSSSSTVSYNVSGFSKDPVNPFRRVAQASNRTPPLYEFTASRLQDVYNVTAGNTGFQATGPNGFPSYLDPLSGAAAPRPYAYFSSYGNNGYDPNDDDSMGYGNSLGGGSPASDTFELSDSGTGNPIGRTFFVSFPVRPSGSIAASRPPNPYTSGPANAAVISAASQQKLSWINPQSFQLMSAGGDGLWGLGGTYNASATGDRLPLLGNEQGNVDMASQRARERDNITNFANGTLE